MKKVGKPLWKKTQKTQYTNHWSSRVRTEEKEDYLKKYS